MVQKIEILIIGAGPVGLFSVFQFGMMGMKCHVIDSLDEIGGQCTALYPDKPIYDIPAYPKITGAALVQQLENQAAPFHPVYHCRQHVISIERQADSSFIVKTDKGLIFQTKIIVIAAGAGAFGPNKPPLKNIENYEGTSIFYAVKNIAQFENKKISIAGGGDSAIDWALTLAPIAEEVFLIHRREKFRAAPASISALEQHKNIQKIIPYQLAELHGEGSKLNAITLKNAENPDEEIILETDILLPFFGLSHNIEPMKNWGINLEKNAIAVSPTSYMTNCQGIYAIGDIAAYEGKLKLILTGFAEAATVAHHAREYLFPTQDFHFEHSTTKGIPNL